MIEDTLLEEIEGSFTFTRLEGPSAVSNKTLCGLGSFRKELDIDTPMCIFDALGFRCSFSFDFS